MPLQDEIKEAALKAAAAWEAEPETLLQVSDSENHVFSLGAPGRRYFLRLTPAGRRSLEQIEAELDFVSHLERGGVRVCSPLISSNGQRVESLRHNGKTFLACVFKEAEGMRFEFSDDASNRKHFRLRGRTLGRIHALSKNFRPAMDRRRFFWYEDELLTEIERYLPASETEAWSEYHRLMQWLRARPLSLETFGLIHGDFGPTNFRCRGDGLTLFDFDDCCYHWFVYDLAIVIYPHGLRGDFAGLLEAMLEGYAEETDWHDAWRDDLFRFCRLRLLYMFLSYARKWGFYNLSEQQRNWFAEKRSNIAQGYRFRLD